MKWSGNLINGKLRKIHNFMKSNLSFRKVYKMKILGVMGLIFPFNSLLEESI